MSATNKAIYSPLRSSTRIDLPAFGVAATPAEEAALLIDQQIAAVRALAGNIPDHRGLHNKPVRTLVNLLLQDAGDGIRT